MRGHREGTGEAPAGAEDRKLAGRAEVVATERPEDSKPAD
jgi:hypothetical protein